MPFFPQVTGDAHGIRQVHTEHSCGGPAVQKPGIRRVAAVRVPDRCEVGRAVIGAVGVIFESEGGYADETIDQPTNMGIIQPTLDSYRKRFPKEAARLKFPQKVKELKRSQAMQIYHRLYFDQYKIGDYRNESIGQLVFDIYVNHTPQTAKEFIDQALKAAR